MDELTEKLERLREAVHKLTKWSGTEVSDLIEEGYLKEGDMG